MAELSGFRMHPGDPAPDFALPGVDGRTHRLSEFADRPYLVVTFWCNHCPYVQKWAARTIALQREFGRAGVQFVLINSNDAAAYPTDDMAHMKARAKELGYPFPYLQDESQEVARAYGALVTPHPMLFGPDRRLLFQGKIDDNAEHPESVREHYLRDAIEAAVGGRPIPRPELPVLGCSVKWRT
jgi:peroxiredoxin